MLGKAVKDSQRDWDEKLPVDLALLCPNKLFLGHKVLMPNDVVMGLPPDEENVTATPHDYLDKLQSV